MKWVYKIISALCAIAILPLLVFSPMVYYYISSVALQGILSLAQMMGSQALKNAMENNELTTIPEGFADDKEVQKKVVDYFATFDSSIVGFKFAINDTTHILAKPSFSLRSFCIFAAAFLLY